MNDLFENIFYAGKLLNVFPVNIVDNKDSKVFKFNVAGFKKEELKVRYDGLNLDVEGKKTEDEEVPMYGEYFKVCKRTIYAGKNLKIHSANLDNGILNVVFNKTNENIEISIS